MNSNLRKFIDIAASIIPALGSLAKDDKTEAIANDLAEVLKIIVQSDDPEVAKKAAANDPVARKEMEIRLAEVANKSALEANRQIENNRKEKLASLEQQLESDRKDHEEELARAAKALESTKAARAHAQKAALSGNPWIANINPVLSIVITLAFLGFVYLIATQEIGGGSSSSAVTAGMDDEEVAPPDEDTQGDNPQGRSNKEVFYVAFGALATAFVTVIGFHFGSSTGSKRKTEMQRIYGTRRATVSGGGGVPNGSNPVANGGGAPPRQGARGLAALNPATAGMHPFQAFWEKELSHIKHFNWEEVLFKGGQNATSGNNTDPPPELYENVVPLIDLLDKIRSEIGKPIKLTSIYRSPAYNKTVGGTASSRHMKFDAADFIVIGPGSGNSGDWSKIARRLRDGGEFAGGIGIYSGFVHVDTRGVNKDWDKR